MCGCPPRPPGHGSAWGENNHRGRGVKKKTEGEECRLCHNHLVLEDSLWDGVLCLCLQTKTELTPVLLPGCIYSICSDNEIRFLAFYKLWIDTNWKDWKNVLGQQSQGYWILNNWFILLHWINAQPVPDCCCKHLYVCIGLFCDALQ